MQLPVETFDVHSIGSIAGTIQIPPSRIQAIAVTLGIAPCGKINGIDYFSAADFERIAQHVRATQPSVVIHRDPTF